MRGDGKLILSLVLAMLAVPAAAAWSGESFASPAFRTLEIPQVGQAVQGGGTASGGASADGEEGAPGSGSAAAASRGALSGVEEGYLAASPEIETDGSYRAGIDAFRILNQSTGEVETVPIAEYVRGAIAAEMPADYHPEALKAQGVAALSYALYSAQLQRGAENPDPALKGADFSADPDNNKGYMTEAGARAFYGDGFDLAWAKLTAAAEEADGLVMLFEGEPVAAAYHAISAGMTESAENIWDGPLAYLTATDSEWDILAAGYRSTATFTRQEFSALCEAEGITLGEDPTGWIEILERSSSGYVTRVRVGDTELRGNRLRTMLGLRSAAFELLPSGQSITFEVRGYGHGAGLSQNGADYLARQGWSCEKILRHYYTGITLAELTE